MSRHVTSAPSCHFIPWRSLYVIVLPSALTSPFSVVGISVIASGTGLAWSSYCTVYENKNGESSSTGLAEANAGLRFFGSDAVEMTSRSACGPDGPLAAAVGRRRDGLADLGARAQREREQRARGDDPTQHQRMASGSRAYFWQNSR